MTERQQFEVFAKGHDMDLTALDTMGGPLYSDCNTDYAWLAWQASRKQALECAAAVARKELERCGTHLYPDDIEYVATAIRSLTTTPGEAA